MHETHLFMCWFKGTKINFHHIQSFQRGSWSSATHERIFHLIYILYKSICIQILCDNKGSACIVTALSFCIDTVLDVVKLCGFIQGLFSSIIVNSLLIRKSDKERLLMLCIMIACCEHFTNFVGSMQFFFCVQIIKLLFHYIYLFC